MATAPTPGTIRPNGLEPDPVGFIIQGVTYTLDLEQLTSTIEKELYDQANLTVSAAVNLAGEGAAFGVQAVIFLSRRCKGETVTYADCEVTFGDILTMTSTLDPDDLEVDGAAPLEPGVS